MSRLFSFVSQIYRGKTLARILFNRMVEKYAREIHGDTLDLAAGDTPSYSRLLPRGINLLSSDLAAPSRTVDANKKLQFSDHTFDTVLFFNALYIVEDPHRTLAEIRRVLRPGGTVLLSSPFLAGEMPEPRDFYRFTAEGLARALTRAGFPDPHIERYGERFSAAVNLLHPFFLFNTARLIAYPLALLLDTLVPYGLRERHPAPLGYFCIARKPAV